MDSSHVEHDLVNILFTEEQIQQRLGEMALQITEDYEGRELLVVGYGLDYRERYRNLRDIGTLAPHVYS